MARWRNMGVLTKLLLVVSIAGLAMIAIGAVGVIQLRSVADASDDIATNRVRQALNVHAARAALLQEDSAVLGYADLQDDVSKRQAEEDIKESDTAFDEFWNDYKKQSRGRVGTHQLIDSAVAFYRDSRDTKILPAAKAADRAKLQEARVQQAQALLMATENLDRIASLENEGVVAGSRDIRTAEQNSTTILLAVLIGGLIAASAIALLIARAIVKPVLKVKAALDAMAGGDLTATVEVHGTDEIGRMAAGYEKARDAMRDTVVAIRMAADDVSVASDQVLRSESRIGESTAAAAEQVNHVVSGANLVSNRVQTLAAGAEETSAAMHSISDAAHRAAQVATEAVTVVENTTETVTELGDSSAQIGEVVKVITAIAAQTNLLALNATIEAARAGELGRGFAVVAGEVKDLASETAAATEDIAKRVAAIQTSSVGAVRAISDISRIIDEINSQQVTIATAVEEQSATTNEMSRNVVEAATGTSEITDAIGHLASSVHAADSDGQAARATANDLMVTAQVLRDAVQRFKA
ncbi:methyl-accepting chemotaxis protein [Virgisporangium aliadipatigenens]|uniref:Methyl-accepting chemotaxis protein n=1 Tax=Virgisporangium aliadipatigenens TaxID=741659 RepID=A0A8J3YIC3_9ACTN|nr:methyl-accepting chemotaxis protein [Virgisporangium aliadipatigenens]GIJ44505.1 methyl-accepting chemotaxis protein [Virgisporangium aliadipatigenens]